MRVLVCGGRTYTDQLRVSAVLAELKPAVVIHGAANGADELADRWAYFAGVPVEVYRAQWHVHGRAAGPIRNKQMITHGQPDLVVAFPGGRGTANMVAQARKAGIRVMEVA